MTGDPQNVTEDLNHTAIARNGRLGPTSTINAGWRGFTDAALVVDPGGLRVFVGGQRSDVRFTVTDAGDPVSGARVRVGGVSGRTGSNGTITLGLPGRSATASATNSGYVRATVRLRAAR